MNALSSDAAGRFAPSPTGPLHLGSLVAALGSYLCARHAGLRWLVRIDDLDRPRVVPGAADAILALLEELGFHWDSAPLWQSARDERYAEILAQLRAAGLVYPCSCSRREILASAPHAGEEGPVYPGTCRDGAKGGREKMAWRLKIGGEPVGFEDGFFGPQEQDLQRAVGDFILARADGLFAYQLATVVDDLDSGVAQVVRGADLLASTPRQIYLYRCLGAEVPHYLHLPLVLGADGEKISKRHGETGIVHSTNGARMMTLALRVLGQELPADLCGAPAPRLLEWALDNFDPARVVPQHRRLEQLQEAE